MIELTNGYFAKADRHQYIVGKLRIDGEGTARLIDPYYYPTLTQAVRGAVSRTLRAGVQDGSITTLQEFIREAERITADFAETLKPLGE